MGIDGKVRYVECLYRKRTQRLLWRVGPQTGGAFVVMLAPSDIRILDRPRIGVVHLGCPVHTPAVVVSDVGGWRLVFAGRQGRPFTLSRRQWSRNRRLCHSITVRGPTKCRAPPNEATGEPVTTRRSGIRVRNGGDDGSARRWTIDAVARDYKQKSKASPGSCREQVEEAGADRRH